MKYFTPLSSHDMQRYVQQMNLASVGVDGQIRLKNAKVLCIGAGGLGTPLLLYLASAGIGTLGIVDDDIVELSNLHRQVLYNDADIGQLKVNCAADKLSVHHPHVNIFTYVEKLTAENAEAIIKQYDIVADCTDNFTTKYLLNDMCVRIDKPLVSASIFQLTGQCMTFSGMHGACLRCLFPDIPHATEFQTCEQGGVLGVLPGLLGLIQATEVMKWILQTGDLLVGRVLMVDILKMQFRDFTLPKNADCEICSKYCNIRAHKNKEPEVIMQEYIIFPQELNELMKNNADIQLVDVRTIEKHLAFNIGGKHIPTAELPDRFNELDPGKPVITYCTSGGNSMRALQFLLSVGFKQVKSLEGGMTAWQNDISIK